MENKQSSGIAGLLLLVVCIVLFLTGKRYFPGLTTKLLIIFGILALLLGLFVAFMLFLAFHQSKDGKKEGKAAGDDEIFREIRSDLLEIRRMSIQIKDMEIRLLSGQICQIADKILKTLKEQPEEIPDSRQFFRYYLPTFRSILSKYLRMETSGVLEPELGSHVMECLEDIKSAMEKQYDNLFEDDRLDLTVEMEALTLVCKRDGLLDEENYTKNCSSLMEGEEK